MDTTTLSSDGLRGQISFVLYTALHTQLSMQPACDKCSLLFLSFLLKKVLRFPGSEQDSVRGMSSSAKSLLITLAWPLFVVSAIYIG